MCRGWLSRRWLRLVLRLVGEKISFVSSELAYPSFVLSCVNLLWEEDFRLSSCLAFSGWFRLKNFDAATLILGPSNVRWSAFNWLSCFWWELGMSIVSVEISISWWKDFPRSPTLSKHSASFVDNLAVNRHHFLSAEVSWDEWTMNCLLSETSMLT